MVRVPPYVTRLYRANCVDNNARAQLASDLASARKPMVVAQPQPVQVAVEEEPRARNRDKAGASTYTVGRGDTLAEIADRKDCDERELARANGIRSPYTLHKGQKIKLVGCYRR